MSLNQKKISFFILIFIFLLSLPILIPDGNAEEICDPESITISCSEDAYVTQNNPDTNYGMTSSFVVGTKNDDLYEAFLYFDLTEVALLEDITSITLILPIYYAPRAMEIDVYLITETWDEYSITYNSKPSLGDFIDSLLIDVHTSFLTVTYELDITDIAKGKSEISLGLQTADTSNSNHYIHADSKDGFSTGARLEVDYLECYEDDSNDDNVDDDVPEDIPEGDDSTTSIPGYNPLILFSCILLGIIIIFMKKHTTKLNF